MSAPAPHQPGRVQKKNAAPPLSPAAAKRLTGRLIPRNLVQNAQLKAVDLPAADGRRNQTAQGRSGGTYQVTTTQGQAMIRGRKFDHVSQSAAAIFLRDGFAASVDDIARAAGVSKATLYSYFPDKKLMFREVLARATDAAFALPPLPLPAPEARPPAAAALPPLLAAIADWMSAPPVLELQRVLIAEAPRFPDCARVFAARCEEDLAVPLARQLALWAELRLDDPERAARQSLDLLRGALLREALLAPGPQGRADRIARAAAEAAARLLDGAG